MNEAKFQKSDRVESTENERQSQSRKVRAEVCERAEREVLLTNPGTYSQQDTVFCRKLQRSESEGENHA
ncbi:hypothetical protein BT69DRAFT_1275252 [Atractiella rhizophila]|nr:hypothetical protein BT69DRAFT_1275252 [Atractiella rhizophila]